MARSRTSEGGPAEGAFQLTRLWMPSPSFCLLGAIFCYCTVPCFDDVRVRVPWRALVSDNIELLAAVHRASVVTDTFAAPSRLCFSPLSSHSIPFVARYSRRTFPRVTFYEAETQSSIADFPFHRTRFRIICARS